MVDMGDDAIGAGRLSPQALARLGRPAVPVLRPPPADDLVAVARWRESVHRGWLDGDPSAEECGHREDSVAGVRVLRSNPVEDGPIVVYLHGGGYALGSPEVALPITERLARCGVEVVSVDYRLAPEHPCPAGIDDAAAVFRALADGHVDGAGGRPIVLAGDSAGANLALSVALDRERGPAKGPAGLVLLSPHLDHDSTDHGSADQGEGDRGEGDRGEGEQRPSDLDDRGARWLVAAYRGSLAPDDLRLSPLRADLTGLPPMLIQVGTVDTSFEHGVRLARRARVAGVEVTLDVWDGLWHTWHYHRDLPEADRALVEAGAFVGALAEPAGSGSDGLDLGHQHGTG